MRFEIRDDLLQNASNQFRLIFYQFGNYFHFKLNKKTFIHSEPEVQPSFMITKQSIDKNPQFNEPMFVNKAIFNAFEHFTIFDRKRQSIIQIKNRPGVEGNLFNTI